MRGTRPKSLALIACVLWAAAWPAGRGQDRPGDATPQVLRVQTRLVQVNAVVTDRQGARVAGLARDDFTIFDGGKDDASASYTIGYYPSHGQWGGKYRAIRMELKRPGLKARTRRGHFAGLQAPAGNQKTKAMLEEAGGDPLEATAVGVSVRLRPFKSYRGDQIEITVSIDPRDLTLEQAAGRWKGSFDLWAIQYTDKGKSKGGISKSSSFNLREESYQKLMREGLSLWFNEDVGRGAERLLVLVRDNPSGKVGWVNVPLRQFLSQASGR